LAAFLEGVSFAGLQQLKATASRRQLRVLGYQDNGRAYIWVFDSQATWHNRLIEQQKPNEIEGATVKIRGLTPGDYSIRWWDTHKGQTMLKQVVTHSTDVLQVTVPQFRCDIACKVTR
jgi:hypothetical protein